MKILVVDGQGGGIGKALIEKLKKSVPETCEIIAVGTNSIATAAMIKAGADSGATGENAVIYNSSRVDIIAGSIGIIAANSIMGELSPSMASAISSSDAVKVLIPLNRCNIRVAGTSSDQIPARIDDAVSIIMEMLK